MVKPVAAANSDWFYHKIFGDGEFIAAGQLVIPPKGMKPSKSTKDNTYVRFTLRELPLFLRGEKADWRMWDRYST